jgi:amino acid transporter
MIGTAFFVLIGQIAELAADLLPIALIAGAIFVAFSSYSDVQF